MIEKIIFNILLTITLDMFIFLFLQKNKNLTLEHYIIAVKNKNYRNLLTNRILFSILITIILN